MAKITNELNVVQGFGTLQKVFNTTATITHGMICSLSAGALVKGYDGTGPAFVAQNDYNNTDAQYVATSYTFTGDSSVATSHSQITVIPVTAAVEVELPTALLYEGIAVGDELISTGVSAATGKYIKDPGTATATIVGTVTELTSDGALVLLEKTVRYVDAG